MFAISYMELVFVLGIGSVILGQLDHSSTVVRDAADSLSHYVCNFQGQKTCPELLVWLGKPLAEQQHTSQQQELNLLVLQRRLNWIR